MRLPLGSQIFTFCVVLLFARLLFGQVLAEEDGSTSTVSCPDAGMNVTGVLKDIQTRKLLVLGESHGSNEVPQYVLGLICEILLEGKSVLLGLEAPSDLSLTYRDWSVGRDNILGSEFWSSRYQDGRTSEAMFRLIRDINSMRNVGEQVNVIGLGVPISYKVPGFSGDNYDQYMAYRLKEVLSTISVDHVVVLTGGAHASKRPFEVEGYGRIQPFASLLERKSSWVVRLMASDGSTWGCYARGRCGVSDAPVDRAMIKPDWSSGKYYTLAQNEDFDALALFGKVSPSPPAIYRYKGNQ